MLSEHSFFYDVRFDDNGKSIGHNIDNEKYKGASIIVSGNNFGCGSSREHAPQAIKKAGFNAVIAGSYAEIFFRQQYHTRHSLCGG